MWAWYLFSFGVYSKKIWVEPVHQKQLILSVWKLMPHPVMRKLYEIFKLLWIQKRIVAGATIWGNTLHEMFFTKKKIWQWRVVFLGRIFGLLMLHRNLITCESFHPFRDWFGPHLALNLMIWGPQNLVSNWERWQFHNLWYVVGNLCNMFQQFLWFPNDHHQ